MSILQLRNHIPIGSPARREPADGAESRMRVSLGFSPDWYHHRCGVDFTEHWHTDPYYRHDALVKMKTELCKSFPRVPYWNLDRQDDLWTLSGVHHAFVIPAVFGCTLQYAPESWAVIVQRPSRSLEDFAQLDVKQVLASPVVENLLWQMDVIEREAGKIHGYLGWQGVLNNAFNLRGQEIFVEMIDQPELAQRFFALITDVMVTLMRLVQARQRQSGFSINQGDVSNCVMNMISPRTYSKFLFQYDEQIAEGFERFGVHTCNWNVTPYLQVLKSLPKLGYLDMGIMSDMKKVREMFPDARRAVMYSPARLQALSSEELQSDMQLIYENLSPCDIVAGDITATMPDSRVNELLDLCRVLERV